MWYSLLGFLITFVLGLVISILSRLLSKGQSKKVDLNLFFPLIARRIEYKRRADINAFERKYPLNDICEDRESVETKL